PSGAEVVRCAFVRVSPAMQVPASSRTNASKLLIFINGIPSVKGQLSFRIADWRLRIADLELNDSFDYDNPQSEIRNPQSPIRNRFQSTCRLMRGADSLRLAAVAM